MGDVLSFQNHGLDPQHVDYRIVAQAKRLMRRGLDLHEVAVALGVRTRDLDLSLWRHIGGGWA
jgi:hypothetical protein